MGKIRKIKKQSDSKNLNRRISIHILQDINFHFEHINNSNLKINIIIIITCDWKRLRIVTNDIERRGPHAVCSWPGCWHIPNVNGL